MKEDLTFYPHPLGLELRQPPYLLTAIWVEFRRAPHRSHYSVSIYQDDVGDIWARTFATLDETKECFEQARRQIEHGIIPTMDPPH